MTTHYPSEPHPGSLHRTICLYGFISVGRAGRRKATSAGQQWRDESLICPKSYAAAPTLASQQSFHDPSLEASNPTQYTMQLAEWLPINAGSGSCRHMTTSNPWRSSWHCRRARLARKRRFCICCATTALPKPLGRHDAVAIVGNLVSAKTFINRVGMPVHDNPRSLYACEIGRAGATSMPLSSINWRSSWSS